MADALTDSVESFSSWWRAAALVTMAGGFAVLILLTVKVYQNAPPIPDKFVDPTGAVVFTADDVIAGQQVFLKRWLCRLVRPSPSSASSNIGRNISASQKEMVASRQRQSAIRGSCTS